MQVSMLVTQGLVFSVVQDDVWERQFQLDWHQKQKAIMIAISIDEFCEDHRG